jgi:glycosyltransferase involved in cell wall biosynthesis
MKPSFSNNALNDFFFSRDGPLYIYGAGSLGREAYLLSKIMGFKIDGFIDNFKSGFVFNLPIYTHDHFVSNNGKNTRIVIAIAEYEYEISDLLHGAGFDIYIKFYTSILDSNRSWFDFFEREVARVAVGKFPLHGCLDSNTLILITSSLSPGGAERQWCYLALELSKLGRKVILLLLERNDTNSLFYQNLLEGSSVIITVIEDFWTKNKSEQDTDSPSQDFEVFLQTMSPLFDPLSFLGSRLMFTLRTVLQFRPATIISQLDKPNVVSALSAALTGCKAILSFRNFSPKTLGIDSRQICDIYRNIYQLVDTSPNIVLTGNSTAGNSDYAEWLNIAPNRIKLIGNFVYPKLDNKLYIEPWDVKLTPEMPTITGVFRLSPEKNPLRFLEICRKLRDEGLSFKGQIAGIGPMQAVLVEYIETYSLGNIVSLLGLRRDVEELLRRSTLCLHTADFEGMPNAIVEALAAGCPVVASNVGAIGELVIHGSSGFVIQPSDVPGFVEACSRILLNPPLRAAMSSLALDSFKKLREQNDPLILYEKLIGCSIDA